MKAIYLGEYECLFQEINKQLTYSSLFINSSNYNKNTDKSLPGFHTIQNDILYQPIIINKNIDRLVYDCLHIYNTEFTHNIIQFCQFKYCVFMNIRFTNMEIINTLFKSCYFINCHFEEDVFTENTFKDCKFENVNVQSCNFTENHINSLHFIQSRFNDCEFELDIKAELKEIKTKQKLTVDNCRIQINYKHFQPT